MLHPFIMSILMDVCVCVMNLTFYPRYNVNFFSVLSFYAFFSSFHTLFFVVVSVCNSVACTSNPLLHHITGFS
jgi:hypothetical protein